MEKYGNVHMRGNVGFKKNNQKKSVFVVPIKKLSLKNV